MKRQDRLWPLAVYLGLYLVTAAITGTAFVLAPHPVSWPGMRVVRLVIIGCASVQLAKYTVYMLLCPWHSVLSWWRSRRQLGDFPRSRSMWEADDAPPSAALASSLPPVAGVGEREGTTRPLVSVLIPAWNEEVGLLSTIKSLLASTYRRLEIVVVNDGSTDGSDALMRRFVEKYERAMAGIPAEERVRLVYHYQPNGGKGRALNTAIGLSSGDILLSIDADCVVDCHAVAAFVRAFEEPTVMAAVGNVRIGNTRTLLGTIQYLEFLFSFFFKKADSLLNTIYIIGGAAGAFRRRVFEDLGGYSTTNITEDIELSMRIQRRGWRIVYCPDALVFTEGASTLSGLMKQRLRWKRGRFQTFWQHRALFFSRERRHNKLLTWVVLPLALFGEMQLALEPVFLAALYVFAWLTGDFSAFLSGMLVVGLMFFIQATDAARMVGGSGRGSRGRGGGWCYLALAPVGWLLFYVCTFVELYALVKAGWTLLRRKEVTWQRWARSGAIDRAAAPAAAQRQQRQAKPQA